MLVFCSDGSESRLGIDLTLTWHFLADSYSILLEESRLGLDRARLFKTRTGSDSKGLTSDGSKWRLGIDSTLAWHFLADSYSIFLEESRLRLDWARLLKTRTHSDSTFFGSTHHYYLYVAIYFTYAYYVLKNILKSLQTCNDDNWHVDF